MRFLEIYKSVHATHYTPADEDTLLLIQRVKISGLSVKHGQNLKVFSKRPEKKGEPSTAYRYMYIR